MKKLSLYALCGLLAACGGGGGGDGGFGGFVPPAIDMPTGTVQSFNGAANESVIARLADGDLIKFNVDENSKITAITYDDRIYNRDGDANLYVNNDGANRTISVATLGAAAGLKYADFGYLQEIESNQYYTDRDIEIFGGGATSHKVARGPDNATYTGTAVAYIQAETPNGITNQVSVTNDASLILDSSGGQKLTMNFSSADKPWYDVTVRNRIQATLSNGANVPENLKVTDDMKQTELRSGAAEFFGASANGTPDEVVQRLELEYQDGMGRELEFNSMFGGTRQ